MNQDILQVVALLPMLSQSLLFLEPRNCQFSSLLYFPFQYECWQIFTKKKHICPNRASNGKIVTQSTTTNNIATSATNNPSYYKKSHYATQQQPKPKMSNSFELLTGAG